MIRTLESPPAIATLAVVGDQSVVKTPLIFLKKGGEGGGESHNNALPLELSHPAGAAATHNHIYTT